MEILKRAADGGTTLMVATPHGDVRARWNDVQSLSNMVIELGQALDQEQVSLSLVLGMENPVATDIASRLEKGSALTINGSDYILMELPFAQLPNYWEEVLFQLQLLGLRPLLAHPERQAQLQKDSTLVARIVERGVLIQVTIGSLAGSFGPKVKKTAEAFLKQGLVHILASDCHGADGSRSPEFRAGFDAARKLVGEEVATRLVSDNPWAIVRRGSSNLTA